MLSITRDMGRVLFKMNPYEMGISRIILRKIFNRMSGHSLNLKRCYMLNLLKVIFERGRNIKEQIWHMVGWLALLTASLFLL